MSNFTFHSKRFYPRNSLRGDTLTSVCYVRRRAVRLPDPVRGGGRVGRRDPPHRVAQQRRPRLRRVPLPARRSVPRRAGQYGAQVSAATRAQVSATARAQVCTTLRVQVSPTTYVQVSTSVSATGVCHCARACQSRTSGQHRYPRPGQSCAQICTDQSSLFFSSHRNVQRAVHAENARVPAGRLGERE